MIEDLPIWVTAQLCVCMYVAGVTIPFLYTYVSPKAYRQITDLAIERYKVRRRTRDDRLYLKSKQANEKLNRLQYNIALLKRNTMNKQQSSSSSSSSSGSSDNSSDEDDDVVVNITDNDAYIEEYMKNEEKVLEQYRNSIDSNIDLFDGQASTTTSAAASTMMMIRAPRRKGRAFNI